jgi:hypothetical protein
MNRSLLLSCLLSMAAFAGPVDDVIAGNGVQFFSATVSYDGTPFAAGAWAVPKAPGSLDLVARVSDFGLPGTDVLVLHGSRSGDVITWTFDHHLSREFVVGQVGPITEVRVTRVHGQIVARATAMSGVLPCSGLGCARNVGLLQAPGSAIHLAGYEFWFGGVYTPGWNADVTLENFTALAGVPRPVLERMTLAQPASRCASTERVRMEGVVTVRTAAPSLGANVTMRSTHPSVYVGAARIAPGARSARFTVTLLPGFSSSARITAAAGGVSDSVLVDRVTCFSLNWPKSVLLQQLIGTPHALTPAGLIVASTAFGDTLTDPSTKTTIDLGKETNLASPKVVTISGNELLLRAAQSDEVVVWNRAVGAGPKIPKVDPVALTATGTALVRDSKGALAQVDAFGLRSLPGLAGLEVTSGHANALGEIAVGLVSGKQTLPAVLTWEGVTKLGTLEGEAVAVLANGTVFGHSGGRAFSCDRSCVAKGGTSMKWLALPKNCSSASLAAANESGWTAGNAQCGGKSGAWLADPSGTVKRIEDLAVPQGIAPREVLGLSDGNVVLVRGVDAQNASIYFLVTP